MPELIERLAFIIAGSILILSAFVVAFPLLSLAIIGVSTGLWILIKKILTAVKMVLLGILTILDDGLQKLKLKERKKYRIYPASKIIEKP